MKGLRAAKNEEKQTLLGLTGKKEEAVTGHWKEWLYGAGLLPGPLMKRHNQLTASRPEENKE